MAGDMAPVVEYLLGEFKALSSDFSTTKKPQQLNFLPLGPAS
jgi:hypothetical protein